MLTHYEGLPNMTHASFMRNICFLCFLQNKIIGIIGKTMDAAIPMMDDVQC